MNEELKARLTKYMDFLESGIQKTVDFSAEQIPDVAREYLAFMFWGSLAYVAICVTVMIISAVACTLVWKNAERIDKSDPTTVKMIPVIFLTIGNLLVAMPMLVINAMIVLKVCVAPKLIILEKVAQILK
jgi:hypothetical protein